MRLSREPQSFSFKAYVSKVDGIGEENSGTSLVKYTPTEGRDEITDENVLFNCISFVKEYADKSLEELRLEDYKAGRVSKELPLGNFLYKFNTAPASNSKSSVKKTGAVKAYKDIGKRFEAKFVGLKNRHVVGEQGRGTTLVKYEPKMDVELFGKAENSKYQRVTYICISIMKEYENKSLEELRLEDYRAGRNVLVKYAKDNKYNPNFFVFGFYENYSLRFHMVHGANIRISKDGRSAELTGPTTPGIVLDDTIAFSCRPISVGEVVHLNLDDIWIHCDGITFGFTTVNPSEIFSYLPKYATSKEKSWTTTLNKKISFNKNILHYSVDQTGVLRSGINGRIHDLIIPGIDISRPLWAVIDLHKCEKVRFVGPEALNEFRLNLAIEGAGHSNQSQVEDGDRRPEQVVDGARRPVLVVEGAGRSNQSQVEDGDRRPEQVVEEAGRTNQSQVDDGARRPEQVAEGAGRSNQSQGEDGARRPEQVVDGARRPEQVIEVARSSYRSQFDDNPLLDRLKFHTVHGGTIRISNDGSTAELTGFQDDTLAFSSRPIRVDEMVHLHLDDIWIHCAIVFGFTTVNPNEIFPYLPKYATSKEKSWTTTLNKKLSLNKNILHYSVDPTGVLRSGVNGQIHDLILPGIDISRPLWAVIDLRRCKKVQFVGPEALNEVRLERVGRSNQSQVEGGDTRPEQVVEGALRSNQSQVESVARRPEQVIERAGSSNQSQVEDGARRLERVLGGARRSYQSLFDDDPLLDQLSSLSVIERSPIPKHLHPVPLSIHRTKGKNTIFTGTGIAARLEGEYCQGYVFSARPMLPGKTITAQILKTDNSLRRSLIIGLTSCDPATIDPDELPDEAKFLQDRPEYWIIYPDAANRFDIGDELNLTLTPDGKLEVCKNGSDNVAVLHVDHTLKLWAFFDIYGATEEIRLFVSELVKQPSNGAGRPEQVDDGNRRPDQAVNGARRSDQVVTGARRSDLAVNGARRSDQAVHGVRRPDQVVDRARRFEQIEDRARRSAQLIRGAKRSDQMLDGASRSDRTVNKVNAQSTVDSIPSTSKSNEQPTNECTICFDNRINCAIYKCGHMCMCYDCAVQQWKNDGRSYGKCPICRAKIDDVIRIYNS